MRLSGRSYLSAIMGHGLSAGMKEVLCEISRKYLSILLLDLIVPEAVRSVIIHHSNSLHKRVTDSGTNKPEASRA
jgi:hypothetical protein